MRRSFIFKSRIEGFARAGELIALALSESKLGYQFDLDGARVKELHRELFAVPSKCDRCGGAHSTAFCPIRADYDPETSADSPKRRGCCDKATNPQD